MIHRHHAAAEILTPSIEGRRDPPADAPAGDQHRRRRRSSKSRNSDRRVALALLFAVGAGLLFRAMAMFADLRFLGGVFLLDLAPAPTPPVEVLADKNSHLSRVAEQEIWEFPDDWEEYSYNDIRHHFRCRRRSKDNNKPLPTLEEWHLMRDTYEREVAPETPWAHDPVPPTRGYSLVSGVPEPPPYLPRSSPGKGRGLFAARDIREGELVHDGTHSDVVFPDAAAWRRYVFSLPPDLACDATDWHWMQRLEEGGPYRLLAGINISSLMNSGGEEFGPGRTPNTLPRSSTSGRFYATRDIREGEEILTDYDSYYTNWAEVGL